MSFYSVNEISNTYYDSNMKHPENESDIMNKIVDYVIQWNN